MGAVRPWSAAPHPTASSCRATIGPPRGLALATSGATGTVSHLEAEPGIERERCS